MRRTAYRSDHTDTPRLAECHCYVQCCAAPAMDRTKTANAGPMGSGSYRPYFSRSLAFLEVNGTVRRGTDLDLSLEMYRSIPDLMRLDGRQEE